MKRACLSYTSAATLKIWEAITNSEHYLIAWAPKRKDCSCVAAAEYDWTLHAKGCWMVQLLIFTPGLPPRRAAGTVGAVLGTGHRSQPQGDRGGGHSRVSAPGNRSPETARAAAGLSVRLRREKEPRDPVSRRRLGSGHRLPPPRGDGWPVPSARPVCPMAAGEGTAQQSVLPAARPDSLGKDALPARSEL